MIDKSVFMIVLLLWASTGYSATAVVFNQQSKASSVSTDRETLGCMQCHDGVLADDVEMLMPGGEPGMLGLHLGKHPVGMNYKDYVIAAPRDYRPLESVIASIELVDGRVSCVSCHRRKGEAQPLVSSQLAGYTDNVCLAYSEIDTGPAQTGLCQSCHIK